MNGCVDNDCALCRAQQEDYRLVYKDTHCFCIANIEPLNDGHFMVLPTRHVVELGDFTPTELKAVHDVLDRLAKAIKSEYNTDALIALNRGANTSQNHTHFHILPSPSPFRQSMAKAHGLPERQRAPQEQLKAMAERLKRHL